MLDRKFTEAISHMRLSRLAVSSLVVSLCCAGLTLAKDSDDKRSPLGTMRFGKRDPGEISGENMFYELYKRSAGGKGLELVEDEAPGLLGDEILPLRDVRAPRQNRAAPFGTMRFGKRYGVGTSSDVVPLGTMRFGKRNPLGTMRFGRK